MEEVESDIQTSEGSKEFTDTRPSVYKLKDITGQIIGPFEVIGHGGLFKCSDGVYRNTWKARCTNCSSESVLDKSTMKKNKCGGCIRCRGLPKGQSGFVQLFNDYKLSRTNRGHEFNLSESQFRNLTSGRCHYCNEEPKQISKNDSDWGIYVYNGIDRKDNNLGYCIKNALSCCSRCNIMKRAIPYEEFIEHLDKIAAHRNRINQEIDVNLSE